MVRIDARALMEKASMSEEGEAFHTVERWEQGRIGVGARTSRLFVEVLVPMFPGDSVNLAWIESALDQLRWLESRGYKLSCRNDMAVSGEKYVGEEEVESEVDAVLRVAGPAT